MTTAIKIKEGLQYTLKPHFIKRDNTSFLQRNKDGVILTCYFSGLECSLPFTDAPISHDFEFTFHSDYLKSFSSDFNINIFPENQQHEICCNTQMILHEIINCKLQGALRNMLLESKALSLLLCFQKCNTANQPDCASCKFLTKPIEKEKILKVKEIILNRLDNPPTIPELSLQIGTNQCYLKKGFKELFGTTVSDFIQEQRMLKAKLLLTTTDFSVSKVADEIGYANAGNFSSAFKRYTGVLPNQVRQN